MSVPRRIRVLDSGDCSLHALAAAGFLGALATGPLLVAPGAVEGLGLSGAAVALVHTSTAVLAALAWLLHLVRVSLGWLEGRGVSALLPRASDLGDLIRTLRWSLFGTPPPALDRFSYRERFSYVAFAVALPVLGVTGWVIAHPTLAFGATGPTGLVLAARLHSGLGVLLFLFAVWHLYFAHLQPELLFWNPVWLTGRAPLETIVALRPAWARRLTAAGPVLDEPEEKPPSVEELLTEGNRAANAGDYARAERYYEQALELYPGYSQALFNLGVCRVRAGSAEGARDALERFIEADPFNEFVPKAQELLGQLRRGGKDG